jgi:hypothetical protein
MLWGTELSSYLDLLMLRIDCEVMLDSRGKIEYQQKYHPNTASIFLLPIPFHFIRTAGREPASELTMSE